MRERTQKGRILALLLTFLMAINLMSPVVFAADTAPKKAVDKPLVIMMNYQDYRFEDVDTKESWRMRGFSADEYDRDYVQQYLFGEGTYKDGDNEYMTIRNYYNTVSGGTFDFNGEVVGPYDAKHGASHYGAQDPDWWDSDQLNAMYLVEEAIENAAKNLDLSEFDINSRDGRGKGIYGKPDGVIDTLIIIHPGRGQEWDNSLGDDAIWPFRCGFTWYDETYDDKTGKYEDGYYVVTDKTGKTYKIDDFVLIGQDSAIDIIIHEYGHVLDLPDLYGWNSPVEYWCMMGGSYTGTDIPGSMPLSYGAYSREFLQKSFETKGIADAKWANLETVTEFSNNKMSSKGIDIELNQAHERLKNGTDLVRIALPDKSTFVTEPASGGHTYFSGNKNNSRTSMKTNLDLTEYSEVNLDFKAWYDIDPYFDFATIRVSKPGEDEFITIKGNITTAEFDEWLMENETEEQRKERNPGHGITDTSGGKWIDSNFNLSDFAGQNIDLTFFFWTDGNTPQEGIYIDDILITGKTVNGSSNVILKDDAEGKSKFDLSGGFQTSDGMSRTGHYYLLEWRNIEEGKIDEGLSHIITYWNQISYEPGLLVWYINEKYAGDGKPDQNAGNHPGEVFAGIIDSDIEPITWKDKPDTRLDMNMRDASFGLRLETAFEYDWGSGKSIDPHISLVPDFNDSKSYTQAGIDYNGNDYYMGLDLTDYGIKILVTEEKSDRSSAKIHIMDRNIKNNPVDYSDGLNVKNIEIVNNSIIVTANNKNAFDLGNTAYIGYINGSTEIYEKLALQPNQDGVYKSSTDFTLNAPNGEYQVSFIILEDSKGNARSIYNSKVHSGYGMDLSNGNIGIQNKTFNDIDIDWAKDSIVALASRNIINGVGNNNFKPYNNITRAEFCKILINIMDVEINSGSSKFSDVSKDKWYYEYINAAAELGIVEGYNGMFNPDGLITREAMATMIQRAAKLEEYGTEGSGILDFTDTDKTSNWAADSILFAKTNGIIKGTDKNEFQPQKNATRAEAAVMIYRVLKLKGIF